MENRDLRSVRESLYKNIENIKQKNDFLKGFWTKVWQACLIVKPIVSDVFYTFNGSYPDEHWHVLKSMLQDIRQKIPIWSHLYASHFSVIDKGTKKQQ